MASPGLEPRLGHRARVQDEVSAGTPRDSLTAMRTDISVLNPPLQRQGEALLAVEPDGAPYNLLDSRRPINLPRRPQRRPDRHPQSDQVRVGDRP